MRELIAKYKSTIIVFVHDLLMIPIAWVLAYWLRYSIVGFPLSQVHLTLSILPILMIIQAVFYWYFSLYRGVWRFASIYDLVRIIESVVAGCLVMIAILFFFISIEKSVPRSIVPLYGLLLIVLLSGPRLFYRYCSEYFHSRRFNKRVLIIGAGSAGEILVRDLLRSTNHDYKPVAFVDDELSKQGKEIHGIRVYGTCADIKRVAEQKKIDVAIIAVPSASALEMRKIVDQCRESQVIFQTLPSISEMASGEITLSNLREVDVEDLLGRDQVDFDWHEIKSTISGKTILISGGGGSIGSEICRQIAKLNPKALIVIERAEFNLYKLDQELANNFPRLNFIAYLGSITDRLMVRRIIAENKPEIIFHAAAYKHVPMLENQVYPTVNNNVIGTQILAEEAIAAQVKKFILISTDKAVRPTNVMGASKRLAEIICQKIGTDSATQFITVRFGNVLGSSGSVVPLFKEQLKNGGPLTVTHPEITRFFMTIPEAVRLIMQACVQGNGGEIFVLDMGEPVKIYYLAEQIIRLSGKKPGVDIEIVYTGLRPGEKLHEELFYQNEESIRTKHQKIFQAKSPENLTVNLAHSLNDLEAAIRHGDADRLFLLLKTLVPEFQAR